MMSDFKAFILKGNVMDLAVGVIIGAAFGKIVDSLVGDIIMPLIAKAVGGGIDFAVTEALSVRVEYRYTDLGSQGFTSTVFPSDSFNAGLDYHTVQMGLSLHF